MARPRRVLGLWFDLVITFDCFHVCHGDGYQGLRIFRLARIKHWDAFQTVRSAPDGLCYGCLRCDCCFV